MPKVKVRWALVQYSVKQGDRELQEFAYRGQVVDLPQKVIDGFPEGSVVAVDMELDRPGTLLALPVAPSDEELISWLIAAKPSEVDALLADRPALAPRIVAVQEHVQRLADYQSEQLDVAVTAAQAAIDDGRLESVDVGESAMLADEGGQGAPRGDTDTGDGSGPQTDQGATGTPEGDPDYPRRPAAEVVTGNVEEVSDYLSVYPDEASAILDAETRTRGDKGPRQGVVTAVQAAAGFTQ